MPRYINGTTMKSQGELFEPERKRSMVNKGERFSRKIQAAIEAFAPGDIHRLKQQRDRVGGVN